MKFPLSRKSLTWRIEEMQRRAMFSAGPLALLSLLVAFALAMPAQADLTVEKTITEIVVDDNGEPGVIDAGDTVVGDIPTFLDGNVPSGTLIQFTLNLEVCAVNGQNVTDIVVTDNFGAEMHVIPGPPSQGSIQVTTKNGTSQKESIVWEVGDLDGSAGDACASVELTATTKEDPDGNQLYTACGLHELNSGPVAKGEETVEIANGRRTRQKRVSAGGDQILLTVSGAAFPQCSNCADDDRDSFVDYPADPSCSALDDDDEFPFDSF
ncbi:MAG: hypothetical protein HY316_10995 [Acidobacteria bacterium]|nr:hypothetical protein [Acidobacteriota bacterium]